MTVADDVLAFFTSTLIGCRMAGPQKASSMREPSLLAARSKGKFCALLRRLGISVLMVDEVRAATARE